MTTLQSVPVHSAKYGNPLAWTWHAAWPGVAVQSTYSTGESLAAASTSRCMLENRHHDWPAL